MKKIEEKILKEGIVIGSDILKVDSFLNHQLDIAFFHDFGKEVKKRFSFTEVDRILTIEASGIAAAFAVAEQYDNVPVTFAKKHAVKTADKELFQTEVKSFTHGATYNVTVSKRFIRPGEHVLIVDDFLANGNAALGLIDICRQAGAYPVGVAVVIEKIFQGGRALVEKEDIPVFAGASVKAFVDGKPVF